MCLCTQGTPDDSAQEVGAPSRGNDVVANHGGVCEIDLGAVIRRYVAASVPLRSRDLTSMLIA
jgi:hypothetical protein